MSATRQRVATGMRWVAQVIGWGVTAFLLLASLIILNYGKYEVGDVLVLISSGIALAGSIASRWRGWVAGILLILTGAGLATGAYVRWTYPWWQGVGLLLLGTGVLFLVSWWLSRKAEVHSGL